MRKSTHSSPLKSYCPYFACKLLMDVVPSILPISPPMSYATSAALGGLVFSVYFIKKIAFNRKQARTKLLPVPAVPGLPVIGNLLQLTEKKPHKTFAKWADTYGPIYSIRTGASTVIVLNSIDVAKEVIDLASFAVFYFCSQARKAMVAKYSSISTRKLSKALTVLTQNKSMVATSDYDEFHKTVKRFILTSMLGPSAQKRHRGHRDVMIESTSSQLYDHVKTFPEKDVNFREIFESELFGIAMKETMGEDVESIYVDELKTTLSRNDIFQILVLDPMEGAIDVDWRDFFPYLRWIPNKRLEKKIEQMHLRRQAVVNALIKKQKQRIASGQEINCYFDFLLSEGKTLTENQMTMLLWETIIETSDTTMVTTEWAMYELAKSPACQDKLYKELLNVCGNEKIKEEQLSQLPYLNAVFHETVRKYSPAPVVPLRYVQRDVELGGYYVPAGSEIAVNIYGCNMDKKRWKKPEEWNPERFLDGSYDPMDLHKTMAFGAGKRACAGALQAMLIACTSIGRLVQEFEWRLKDGEEENVDTHGLTTRKLHPLYAMIKPRIA